MDFDQPITPDFNADEVDIFAELGAPSLVQPASSNPLHNILLEEEEHEMPEVDPVLVAELLQVLAQHNIRQQSEDGFDALPESARNIDLNSARVTLSDDEYRLSYSSNFKVISRFDHVSEFNTMREILISLKRTTFPPFGNRCMICWRTPSNRQFSP